MFFQGVEQLFLEESEEFLVVLGVQRESYYLHPRSLIAIVLGRK